MYIHFFDSDIFDSLIFVLCIDLVGSPYQSKSKAPFAQYVTCRDIADNLLTGTLVRVGKMTKLKQLYYCCVACGIVFYLLVRFMLLRRATLNARKRVCFHQLFAVCSGLFGSVVSSICTHASTGLSKTTSLADRLSRWSTSLSSRQCASKALQIISFILLDRENFFFSNTGSIALQKSHSLLANESSRTASCRATG